MKIWNVMQENTNHSSITVPSCLRFCVICGAIAYYVTPDDVIPEQIYGPYGYIDDIYLSSYVLKMVANLHGYEFIEKISSPDIKDIINECESKSLEILNEDEIKSILNYCGLKS